MWLRSSKKLPVRRARMLQVEELPGALELCSRVPVESVLVTTRISAMESGSGPTQVWGFPASGPLEALCWIGANVVPVVPPETDREAALDAFADVMLTSARLSSSIVGQQQLVRGLWTRIDSVWSVPREIRWDQPSLAIERAPEIDADPHVRLSRRDEFDVVLPACVRMFAEEVGYSPLSGSGRAYEERVRSLIDRGRSYIRRSRDGIEFKAEIGAVGTGVAQVQGVWVPPRLRGRGLAAPGMAAVVEAVRSEVTPVVSLYVNNYNLPALATYRSVGFEQVGTFSTILF